MTFLRKLNEDELAHDAAAAGFSTTKHVASGGAPSTAPKTDTMPLSQVSQDEYGLPKVPCSDGSSDLDLGKPLPISKQEIRTLKAAQEPENDTESVLKRPASGLKRPAARGGKNIATVKKGNSKSKASSFKRPAASEAVQATEDSKGKGTGNQGDEAQLYTSFWRRPELHLCKGKQQKKCGRSSGEAEAGGLDSIGGRQGHNWMTATATSSCFEVGTAQVERRVGQGHKETSAARGARVSHPNLTSNDIYYAIYNHIYIYMFSGLLLILRPSFGM